VSLELRIDASSGAAGDMLAASLIDAGVPLEIMQSAVDSILPGVVSLSCVPVMRSGIRAVCFQIEPILTAQNNRAWRTIRSEINASRLAEEVKKMVHRVFHRLAVTEAKIHNIEIEDVHFHEIGSIDSIVDVVSVCAGIHFLQVSTLSVGIIEMGLGRSWSEHGNIPVPTPAGLAMTEGWRISSMFEGESATPTGVAILTELFTQKSIITEGHLFATGYGAGTRDPSDHPNIVRAILLETQLAILTEEFLIETNIDDLDPRLWPGVIASLIEAGAKDAWIAPISMKKSRSAFTLSALCARDPLHKIESIIFTETSAIGIRRRVVQKISLERRFVSVNVYGIPIALKIAQLRNIISNVSPEFEDVAEAAKELNLPAKAILDAAKVAAANAGFIVGAKYYE
jgi:uncharacterized protein (TIGR00299 family) protein